MNIAKNCISHIKRIIKKNVCNQILQHLRLKETNSNSCEKIKEK